MKNLIIAASFLCLVNAFATTDDSVETRKYVPPTETEISANRACFQELERQGCRTIEEDPEQFRACLSNAQPALDEYCQKMMLDLYGTK